MGRSMRSLVVVVGLAVSLSVAGAATAQAGSKPSSVVTVTAAPGAGVTLPADWAARRDAAAARVHLTPSPAEQAVGRVIDPGDYECGPTALDAYVGDLLAGMTDDDLEFLFTSGVLDFPTLDALVFGASGDPAYALRADYRTELSHAFRDARRFWDIPSADIQLLAMHGDVLLDQGRLQRLLTVVYGLSPADAAGYAAQVVARMQDPVFGRGSNPLFTLNAFAFTGEGDPDPFVASLPDKLIFGDGVLDALKKLGLGDVGPRAVLAHEFGHHVQFENDVFDNTEPTPEATRRTELMADALGTYFSTHSRGLALNAKRVLQAESTFYIVGDCAFDNPGHHGTPNQRLRAATWGVNLADSARKQGHILPSATVIRLFDAALPTMVAPDA